MNSFNMIPSIAARLVGKLFTNLAEVFSLNTIKEHKLEKICRLFNLLISWKRIQKLLNVKDKKLFYRNLQHFIFSNMNLSNKY
jgi:hypothetical protein